jgi:elongation factor P
MQTVMPSEFKRNLVIMLDGAPQTILEFHTSGTAQTRHKLHVRLRNLKSGRITERVFAETERLQVADLAHRQVQFSYTKGDSCVFTDNQTFEEFEVPIELLGERKWFLKDSIDYTALILDGKVIDVVFPPQVALKVVETTPAQRGVAESSWKTAKVDSGLELMVPLFIDRGDPIRIDTETRKYLGKDNT